MVLYLKKNSCGSVKKMFKVWHFNIIIVLDKTNKSETDSDLGAVLMRVIPDLFF